ncbi:Stress responsive A/B Barrel Domain [Granulicella pectinivorans]|uniref:Stress responsive A/B Barrel Domain n=1 Tax=Granulicella pectinivorans TaxID=474950 RepID=A0A1I6MKX7_9BACT|nr:Dabb family protein [Granulicella pectinivorans]SFS16258.1 Stress responsive A/B Barrel Domain [Granulicella pectinivorans]
MFIHVFAFRWQPGVTPAQKEQVAAAIRSLQGQIPGLIETFVGTNLSPRGQGYEFGGVMKFEDQATFERYNPHPAHAALLGWLLPLIEPLELDFEV